MILGGYLYIHLGAFKDIQVKIANEPSFHIIYKNHVGPYHKINGVIRSVEKWVQEQNLSCTQTFGEYLDNPDKVPHERLRSHGGCLTPQKFPNLPEGFFQRTVTAQSYIEAKFSGSPAIGPFAVYPKIKRFASKKRLKTQEKSFEIYEIQGANKIHTRYLIPLSHSP